MVLTLPLILTFLLADLPPDGSKHSRTCGGDAWAALCSMGVEMNRGQSAPTRPASVIADWLADAAARHASDRSLGRCTSLRYTGPTPLEPVINPGTSSEQCISATGISVSEGGMALFVRHALPIGAALLLRYAGEDDVSRWGCAEAMYAKRSVNGYRVGVRFELPPVT